MTERRDRGYERPRRPHIKLRDGKTEKVAAILRSELGPRTRRVLVVGCGSGLEAAILASELDAEVIGVDPDAAFDPDLTDSVELRTGDATALEFADESFDLVYCYHVLEHIPRYHDALAEMCRVLVAGGGCCVGTPNRQRIVGYLGSKNATMTQKVRWNVGDWRRRLTGQFTNEAGAHAGFSPAELGEILGQHFPAVTDITTRYYAGVYPTRVKEVRLISRFRLGPFVFPSVYFLGHR